MPIACPRTTLAQTSRQPGIVELDRLAQSLYYFSKAWQEPAFPFPDTYDQLPSVSRYVQLARYLVERRNRA